MSSKKDRAQVRASQQFPGQSAASSSVMCGCPKTSRQTEPCTRQPHCLHSQPAQHVHHILGGHIPSGSLRIRAAAQSSNCSGSAASGGQSCGPHCRFACTSWCTGKNGGGDPSLPCPALPLHPVGQAPPQCALPLHAWCRPALTRGVYDPDAQLQRGQDVGQRLPIRVVHVRRQPLRGQAGIHAGTEHGGHCAGEAPPRGGNGAGEGWEENVQEKEPAQAARC